MVCFFRSGHGPLLMYSENGDSRGPWLVIQAHDHRRLWCMYQARCPRLRFQVVLSGPAADELFAKADRQQPNRASAYEDAMSTNNGGSTVRVTMHPSSTTQVLNICFVSTHGFYTHACFNHGLLSWPCCLARLRPRPTEVLVSCCELAPVRARTFC